MNNQKLKAKDLMHAELWSFEFSRKYPEACFKKGNVYFRVLFGEGIVSASVSLKECLGWWQRHKLIRWLRAEMGREVIRCLAIKD
jgi:hypothetical protein